MPEKTAIITGGAQGIGKIIAMRLLENNYKVAIFDNDEEAGTETYQEIKDKGDLNFFLVDIASEQSVKQNIEGVKRTFETIDVLINNAAIENNKPIEELALDEWQDVINVNLTGAFLCSKYAIPSLRRSKGNIINICSTRAFMSEGNKDAYAASKGGIFSLTHSLAISLGPDIRVNSISPGWVDVSSLKKSSVRIPEFLKDEDHTQHPVGRVGSADDIASMILFLIDDKNSFITGQNFTVDGGMTKKMIYL
jgi:NAD(P)-dependent dehydrogenase (short-subunit alcohol dehydrogenase family)